MKMQEVNKMSMEDIKDKLETLTEQLAKMKLAHKITPLENPIQIRNVRRDIARLKTELNNRKVQA